MGVSGGVGCIVGLGGTRYSGARRGIGALGAPRGC